MHPLELNAQPDAWRIFFSRKTDPGFKKFYDKVLERDRHTCQYCGFQAKDFQEVVNLDQNYRNNRLSNLVTACVFCTQCFFLESVGSGDFGGGTLIYLPEISQSNLNSFCHVLFCAIVNDTGYKATAQAVYRSIKFRSQIVEQTLGDGMSEPATMGRLLIENETTKEKRNQFLGPLRLLPIRARFRKQIEFWAASALQELSAQDD